MISNTRSTKQIIVMNSILVYIGECPLLNIHTRPRWETQALSMNYLETCGYIVTKACLQGKQDVNSSNSYYLVCNKILCEIFSRTGQNKIWLMPRISLFELKINSAQFYENWELTIYTCI